MENVVDLVSLGHLAEFRDPTSHNAPGETQVL